MGRQELTAKNANRKENDEDQEKDEENAFLLLERRLSQVEQRCGVSNAEDSLVRKLEIFLISRVHPKLLNLESNIGLVIAVLVLLSTTVFVIGFSIHRMRNTCTPNLSLIDGDLPAFANQENFRESGNVFICTTSYNNFFDLQGSKNHTQTNIDQCGTWTPCTLNGLSAVDYELKATLCPVSFNGCYRNPNCIEAEQSFDKTESFPILNPDPHAIISPVEVCESRGLPETPCQGIVSVTYYACPDPWTVIGASLGYWTIVQLGTLSIFVGAYLALRFVVNGRSCSLTETSSDKPPSMHGPDDVTMPSPQPQPPSYQEHSNQQGNKLNEYTLEQHSQGKSDSDNAQQ